VAAGQVARSQLDHVIARQRNGVLLPGQLHLEDHLAAIAEAELASGQIEFPTSGRNARVERPHHVAVGREALTRRAGSRHSAAEYFDVGDTTADGLNGLHHLGQRRRVAAREDILLQPGVGAARAVHGADRMQQGDAVIRQQVLQLLEELAVVRHADMLEARRRRYGRRRATLPIVAAVERTRSPGRRRPRAASLTLCCSTAEGDAVRRPPASWAR